MSKRCKKVVSKTHKKELELKKKVTSFDHLVLCYRDYGLFSIDYLVIIYVLSLFGEIYEYGIVIR
jgi:hypothetical protein